MLLNCLLKCLAITVGLMQILDVQSLNENDMGCLEGILGLLPEKFRLVLQNLLRGSLSHFGSKCHFFCFLVKRYLLGLNKHISKD